MAPPEDVPLLLAGFEPRDRRAIYGQIRFQLEWKGVGTPRHQGNVPIPVSLVLVFTNDLAPRGKKCRPADPEEVLGAVGSLLRGALRADVAGSGPPEG